MPDQISRYFGCARAEVDSLIWRRYGSLIWSPPEHIASVEVVYAKGGHDGWLRRFAGASL